MKSFQTALTLLRYLAKPRPLFLAALGVVLLTAFLQPFRPYLYRYVIDHPLREGSLSVILMWGLILVGVVFLQAGFQRLQALLTQRLAWAVVAELRHALFRKVLRLSIPVLEKYPSGVLYTRTLTDTQSLQSTLAETFLVIAGELLQLLFLVGLMLLLDLRLAIITLLTLPIGLFTSQYFSRKIRESFIRVRYYIAQTNGFLQDLLQSRETTESLGADGRLQQLFHRLNRLYYLSYRRVVGYFAWFFPAMETVTLIGLTAVLLAGTYWVYKGQTTLGTLIAFALYQQLFFRPFRIIADQVNSLQMGLVSADRIFRLLHQAGEEPQGGKTPALPPPYTLEIEGLSFAYPEGKVVFQNLSLSLKPGSVYGLTAPTGRGKSTLFYLLLGYYEAQGGLIKLGGLPLSEWDKAKLRHLIAYIPQEPVMFEGSLRENLTLYADYTDAELWAAAERLGIAHYVRAWNLSMLIGPGGNNLSAGERQLIALWRAALHQPVLWLLDEPTAHIDTEIERLIYHRLHYLAQKAIVILVAHRPETQAYCDEILSLELADAA
ncbi:MAG: ABC transporter ATP-binding protein/permease [Bacteroidia bacterium]|nr:ABC transporter ATP-binding protein/permease [Bacteroidia bacterium]MDW8089263.1 ABC transporter ATP-binding protein [Bacteroidia bacterium]